MRSSGYGAPDVKSQPCCPRGSSGLLRTRQDRFFRTISRAVGVTAGLLVRSKRTIAIAMIVETPLRGPEGHGDTPFGAPAAASCSSSLESSRVLLGDASRQCSRPRRPLRLMVGCGFGLDGLGAAITKAAKHFTDHKTSKPVVGYHTDLRGLLPYKKRSSFGYFHMCR